MKLMNIKMNFNKWRVICIKDLDYLHNTIHGNGIFKFFEVGHQRFAWIARTNEKIIKYF